MSKWLLLSAAIVAEVIATSSLKASAGFTNLWPSVVVVVGYTASFYLFSLTLKSIPIGIAYVVWSGVGVALIALIGWVFYDQPLDTAAIIGMVLIVSGVVVLNGFSSTVSG
jgi:small multidrug resistance pump